MERIASSDILIIVGMIITVSINDAVSILKPVPPKCTLIIGTSTISPKNPYTTEGIPASVSITGFNILRMVRGAISAMKIAQSRDNGTAKSNARAVIPKDPTIIGKIP